jgi:hypothetical protein
MKPGSNLVIDIVALVVYLFVANPAVTGLLIHEWLSLGLLVVCVVHVAAHLDWVQETFRHLLRKATFSARANLVLDILTLLVFVIVMVSGIMVSRHILPAFGLVAPGYFFWNPLHSISAKMLLALLVIHVVVHWRWIVSLFDKGMKKR